ncbi:hypothetical protein HNP40_001811 [Mycobacteroides chelonae]|nr:hypothetical protein [Mycobacteroides chelonae]
MCKRLVMSGSFYTAVQRPNVSLVVDPIERIVPEGVVTENNAELHDLDVLILATGFDAHAFMRPMTITGRDDITLGQAWAEGPRAYKTVAIPGFPNFFTIMGPHSPVGNSSLIAIAETQVNYITQWIQRWQTGDFDTAEPTNESTVQFYADVRAAMPDTIWTSGCTSWYLGQDSTPELWPWLPQRHRTVLARPDASEFILTGGRHTSTESFAAKRGAAQRTETDSTFTQTAQAEAGSRR